MCKPVTLSSNVVDALNKYIALVVKLADGWHGPRFVTFGSCVEAQRAIDELNNKKFCDGRIVMTVAFAKTKEELKAERKRQEVRRSHLADRSVAQPATGWRCDH